MAGLPDNASPPSAPGGSNSRLIAVLLAVAVVVAAGAYAYGFLPANPSIGGLSVAKRGDVTVASFTLTKRFGVGLSGCTTIMGARFTRENPPEAVAASTQSPRYDVPRFVTSVAGTHEMAFDRIYDGTDAALVVECEGAKSNTLTFRL
jgi:hypothetical protein